MRLNDYFGAHMVLQRGRPIRVFGEAEDGMQVRVSLGDSHAEAVASGGAWVAELPPMEVARGLTLRVTCGEDAVELEDISVGDVFLAGGQSNMEFHMRYDAELREALADCPDPDVRFYDVPEISFDGQETLYDYSQMGVWRPCDAENLQWFSTVGYWFAREIAERQGVPVGVVGCNWGGTVASAWMDEAHLLRHGRVWLEMYEEGLKRLPSDYEARLRDCQDYRRGTPFDDPYSEELLFGASPERQRELSEEFMKTQPGGEAFCIGPCDPNRPCQLYHRMLSKLRGVEFAAVLWYQGESDAPQPEIYGAVWGDMIDCWRETFRQPLPFFAVQLAPFEAWMGCTGDAFPTLRAQQMETARTKPDVHLISSGDAGERWDIHPKRKRPIGERLALSARRYLYGEDVPCESPRLRGMHVEDGRAVLEFDHAYGKLTLRGEKRPPLRLFVREGGGERELPPEAWSCHTEGAELIVDFDHPPRGSLRAELGETPYYEMNLYSAANLPAMPGHANAEF